MSTDGHFEHGGGEGVGRFSPCVPEERIATMLGGEEVDDGKVALGCGIHCREIQINTGARGRGSSDSLRAEYPCLDLASIWTPAVSTKKRTTSRYPLELAFMRG